jgi:nucleotide-binding universal stress UspA family protein
MIERILIATDDGPPARCAVDAGVELALQLAAQIHLLHVVDLARAFRADLGVTDDAAVAELRACGKRLLDNVSSRIPAGLMPHERAMPDGDPAEEIIRAAQEWATDLIVIGSDSRGRLAHFLLGSTADAVIRRAPCPVVTVRGSGSTKRQGGVSRTAIRAGA